ncbi:MAG: NAD-dependent epimerase/dehydratase family protein [Synergistota bacterium]|nr:NAD-dependent epimerase/dehydratase family protein [Synergistota bacterium]
MKRIMVTGANGQIGVELVVHLRKLYGAENVLATARRLVPGPVGEGGPFQLLDVRDGAAFSGILGSFRADTVIHLAGILSAKGESDPVSSWDINVNGTCAALEAARAHGAAFFLPSSIAAFGPSTPARNTPQDTIQRPTTIYGVAKVSLELLCDYYHKRFGLDTRGLRFPGLISYEALPGGGTTDYAVHIYYDAVKKGSYTSFIAPGTCMDMMYMPDALDAVVQLMEADPARLVHRNAFNVSAMSFEPEQIAASIRKVMPGFAMDYDVDPLRQSIAESWPDSLDCSAAREEWGFAPKYDLDRMTEDMLSRLKNKI